MAKINIVFEERTIDRDAASIPEYVFVEVETINGESINAGKWIDFPTGHKSIQIDLEALNAQLSPAPHADIENLAGAIPAPGEYWRHHSGRLYRIDDVRNTKQPPKPDFPVTVCYTSVDDDEKHSRRLDDWHRSFGINPVLVGELKPYFSFDQVSDEEGLFNYAIRRRPVYTKDANGKIGITLGFILALVEGELNAKIVTDTLNRAFPPNPNEPKD